MLAHIVKIGVKIPNFQFKIELNIINSLFAVTNNNNEVSCNKTFLFNIYILF